jgi:hypothetical protein
VHRSADRAKMTSLKCDVSFIFFSLLSKVKGFTQLNGEINNIKPSTV